MQYTVRHMTYPLGGYRYDVTSAENYIPIRSFSYADEPWRAERDAVQCADEMNRQEAANAKP